MEIRTERLLLRPPTPDDLDAFFRIMSNPVSMRYWSTLPHADPSVTRSWLETKLARNAAGGQDFAIVHDGQVIGEVGAARRPEFGFILDPEYWGRGLGMEAATAFIAHVFATTQTAAITSDVDPRNVASLRLLARLGFAETGRASNTFLLGSEWCDSVYLSLPRPDATSTAASAL